MNNNSIISNYCKKLKLTKYSGEIVKNDSYLSIASHDNSIYEITPKLVLHPKNKKDVQLICKIANQKEFNELSITGRGAATGTNGQSLNYGLIVDFSKYMNKIKSIDLKNNLVKMEPGVVLDQLNTYLEQYDKTFPIYISTANRATIGGMINTNASGKGSRVLGRTIDYIKEIEFINYQGNNYKLSIGNKQKILDKYQNDIWWLKLIENITVIYQKYNKEYKSKLPQLIREFSGYDFNKFIDSSNSHINLLSIIAGSESTLGLIGGVTLKITDIIKYNGIVLVLYDTFIDSLTDVNRILKLNPSAIETIDEYTLNLALKDRIGKELTAIIGKIKPGCALNIIEFKSNNLKQIQDQIDATINQFNNSQKKKNKGEICFHTTNKETINKIWKLRSRGVGLLNQTKGKRKPIPFVEDCVVSTESLAEFITEFKQILDSYNLEYGMYGHVDVGCVHVRPAINLSDKENQKLVKIISDKIFQLVQKQNGIFWGEHGKGIRSKYIESFLDVELNIQMRKIKSLFDPKGKFNPGKLYNPIDSKNELYEIDEIEFKTKREKNVNKRNLENFKSAFQCDGNGECLTVNHFELMCPSYKMSNDRLLSPNGRSRLIRHWLINKSIYENKGLSDTQVRKQLADITKTTFESLDSCLSCKACTGLCPALVDIPDLKSKFLNWYYKENTQSLSDIFTARFEQYLPLISLFPKTANTINKKLFSIKTIRQKLGFVDVPNLAENKVSSYFKKNKLQTWKIFKQRLLKEKTNSIIIIPDAFNNYFDPHILADTITFLNNSGYNIYLAKYKTIGKGSIIKGQLNYFKKIADIHVKYISNLFSYTKNIVSVEPSIGLMYKQEYKQRLKDKNLLFIEQFLYNQLKDPKSKISIYLSRRLKESTIHNKKVKHILFSHCSQNSCDGLSNSLWQKIFLKWGINVKIAKVGCCGMAGIFGHEKTHYNLSKEIFESSWKKTIENSIKNNELIMATGYSCRSQIKRFMNQNIKHPIQILAKF